MRRWFGLVLILAGYLVLTLTLPGLGAPVLSITATHGVELSDVLGGVAIVIGVASFGIAEIETVNIAGSPVGRIIRSPWLS
jgi:hypothetical protein